MSAQSLSFAELLEATRLWVEAGPAAAFLAGSDVARPFLPLLRDQRARLAIAPPETSELARLTQTLGEIDAEHDRAARLLYAQLASYQHDELEPVRATAVRLSRALLPDGAAVVRKSYAEQAGRVEARDAALTPELRRELASFPLTQGRTLETVADRLQSHGRRIGELLQERRALGGEGAELSALAVLSAKRSVIAIVEQVLQSFRMLEDALDDTARAQVRVLSERWQRAVREATERAERRRAGDTPPTGTPVPVP